jgi:hypothetical protein
MQNVRRVKNFCLFCVCHPVDCLAGVSETFRAIENEIFILCRLTSIRGDGWRGEGEVLEIVTAKYCNDDDDGGGGRGMRAC